MKNLIIGLGIFMAFIVALIVVGTYMYHDLSRLRACDGLDTTVRLAGTMIVGGILAYSLVHFSREIWK